MKTKLATIGLAMLGFVGVASAQTAVISVSANPLWTDTGIAVTNGEWVTINDAGFWSWPSATDPDGVLDAVSNDIWLLTGTHGSLIAFIGVDPYQGSEWGSGVFQTNQYLEIGTARQFLSATNGELWLGINDDAFVGTPSDNSGTNYATVSVGINCDDNFSNMVLSVASVTSNTFAFYISNGIPDSICAIYDSADLTHWTLLDSLKLDDNGSSTSATDNNPPDSGAGLQSGAFVNNTAVPYRFYKVSNGPFWSDAIGFEQMTVGPGTITYPGTNGLIADQLIAPANTLNALLTPMVDGSTVPDGTIIKKWRPGGYDIYTYSSGSWSPNGNATMLPGEAVFMTIPTNSPSTTITFAGLVPQGVLTNYAIPTAFVQRSSMIPQAGGLQFPLDYIPNLNDFVWLWVGINVVPGGYYIYDYAGAGVGTSLGYQSDWTDANSTPPSPPAIPGDQLDSSDDVYWAPAPQLNVGQGFWFDNYSTNMWVRKFPGCCGQ